MALLLFRGVIQAVLEATGAALAENSEIVQHSFNYTYTQFITY